MIRCCAKCAQPTPTPTPLTRAQAVRLNETYEAARARWRAAHPLVTREELARLEDA